MYIIYGVTYTVFKYLTDNSSNTCICMGALNGSCHSSWCNPNNKITLSAHLHARDRQAVQDQRQGHARPQVVGRGHLVTREGGPLVQGEAGLAGDYRVGVEQQLLGG